MTGLLGQCFFLRKEARAKEGAAEQRRVDQCAVCEVTAGNQVI
jgi:hypothetical protein